MTRATYIILSHPLTLVVDRFTEVLLTPAPFLLGDSSSCCQGSAPQKRAMSLTFSSVNRLRAPRLARGDRWDVQLQLSTASLFAFKCRCSCTHGLCMLDIRCLPATSPPHALCECSNGITSGLIRTSALAGAFASSCVGKHGESRSCQPAGPSFRCPCRMEPGSTSASTAFALIRSRSEVTTTYCLSMTVSAAGQICLRSLQPGALLRARLTSSQIGASPPGNARAVYVRATDSRLSRNSSFRTLPTSFSSLAKPPPATVVLSQGR